MVEQNGGKLFSPQFGNGCESAGKVEKKFLRSSYKPAVILHRAFSPLANNFSVPCDLMFAFNKGNEACCYPRSRGTEKSRYEINSPQCFATFLGRSVLRGKLGQFRRYRAIDFLLRPSFVPQCSTFVSSRHLVRQQVPEKTEHIPRGVLPRAHKSGTSHRDALFRHGNNGNGAKWNRGRSGTEWNN